MGIITMRRGYKVVVPHINGDKFYSCSLYRHYAMVYVKDVPTRRKKGYGAMALFDDRRDAMYFRSTYVPRGEVWLCNYEPSNDRLLWVAGDIAKRIKSGWGRKDHSIGYPFSSYANSVTLWKRVYNPWEKKKEQKELAADITILREPETTQVEAKDEPLCRRSHETTQVQGQDSATGAGR